MSLKLITGASGGAHVTSADAGAFNCGLYDEEKGYILPTGRQFDIDLITSDTVRIYDGDVVFQGRHCRIENGAFVDINIPPCPAGSTRFDVIAIRYTLDTGSGTESVEFVLKQGTLDESLSFAEKIEAIMNMTVVGSIPSGDQTVDLPVFTIYHEGTNIVNYGKTLPIAKSIIDVDKRVDNILDEQLMVPIIVQHGEAGYYFENNFHPFVDAPEFEYLGTTTITSTTKKTMTLSGNISDYKYLLLVAVCFLLQLERFRQV